MGATDVQILAFNDFLTLLSVLVKLSECPGFPS